MDKILFFKRSKQEERGLWLMLMELFFGFEMVPMKNMKYNFRIEKPWLDCFRNDQQRIPKDFWNEIDLEKYRTIYVSFISKQELFNCAGTENKQTLALM
jgi:hypothetical protein